MDGNLSAQGISSPASTGGAGTFFEQHVGAYLEVHFQTERLGWQTDDFLIV